MSGAPCEVSAIVLCDDVLCQAHVDDVIEACAHALEARPEPWNGTYTLAGPCVTMSGFADALGEVFQRHPRLLRIPARAASALAAAARVLPLPIYPGSGRPPARSEAFGEPRSRARPCLSTSVTAGWPRGATSRPRHMTIDAARFRARGRVAEGACLALATLACAAMYVATDAPLYNPVGTIDPWLYTALWTNFDQIYHYFVGTYYASRLPWIVPGYALNLLFDQQTAYFVIHIAFFFAGAILFYSLCRRWFELVPALIAYIGLTGNQMYFNEHRWDYETGGALTFMIASVAFALPKTKLIQPSVREPGSVRILRCRHRHDADRGQRVPRGQLAPAVCAAPAKRVVTRGCGTSRSTSARSPQGHCCSSSGWASSRSGTTATSSCSSCRNIRAVFSTNSGGYQQAVSDWLPRSPLTSSSRPSSSCSRRSSCC